MDFGRPMPADTGRPGYHPAVLLKLYLDGYLNRVPSSRRLEREAQSNLEVLWLTGRLAPDFKPTSIVTTALPSRDPQPLLRRATPDVVLDAVKRANPIQRPQGDLRLGCLVHVEELASRVRQARRFDHPAVAAEPCKFGIAAGLDASRMANFNATPPGQSLKQLFLPSEDGSGLLDHPEGRRWRCPRQAPPSAGRGC